MMSRWSMQHTKNWRPTGEVRFHIEYIRRGWRKKDAVVVLHIRWRYDSAWVPCPLPAGKEPDNWAEERVWRVANPLDLARPELRWLADGAPAS